jgi:prepilin-type N-terminal cleavage/methylation domain-containing protein/prepilin-type processing-associated H-X9-DG protein
MSFYAPKKAFTLIELLVVIAIISILAAILFPVFGRARENARKSSCLSNLKQQGLGLQQYIQDYDGFYPRSSYGTPKFRWADAVQPYTKSRQIFICPSALEGFQTNEWNPSSTEKYGGYGYNYQYLGNARPATATFVPFSRADADISAPAQTVAIADSQGVAWEDPAIPLANKKGTYTIDPPLTSANGSGKPSGYYGDGAGECGGGGTGVVCRSVPAMRHLDFSNVAFADGHAKAMKLSQLDDFNGDGTKDNGFWNGRANLTP